MQIEVTLKSIFIKLLEGYQVFRKKYAQGDKSVMQYLAHHGQKPQSMVISCCDSRVDPALIMQCDPGDLYVIRNVANVVPPYEKDEAHHGTSAALEFGVRFLNIKHLILFGHSQCGGIQALLNGATAEANDFITNWVSIVKRPEVTTEDVDFYAKLALDQSYRNCLTFPWVKDKVESKELIIHVWFFDIKTGQIFTHSPAGKEYQPLDAHTYIHALTPP
jgi:carbonic anhydrase